MEPFFVFYNLVQTRTGCALWWERGGGQFGYNDEDRVSWRKNHYCHHLGDERDDTSMYNHTLRGSISLLGDTLRQTLMCEPLNLGQTVMSEPWTKRNGPKGAHRQQHRTIKRNFDILVLSAAVEAQ